ncbi:MAG: SAM-dependent methyltransferase [Ruminococcus sp.]|nr:SAM-dependent methyltransferase [Ruminococcus sp.]
MNSIFKRISGIKTNAGFKLEKLTEKQSFTEIINENSIPDYLDNALFSDFRNLTAWDETYEYSFRVSKKGKLLFTKTKNSGFTSVNVSHNREKKYLLADGVFAPPLYDMGLQTADGKIKADMRDKFRQLNRFIEIIDDVTSKIPPEKPISIVDFGCGKSYLTFAVYYYLTELCRRKVTMSGLDLKEDVIKNCNETAKKYGYENLTFLCGDINSADLGEFDIMITLHACDTATDYALFYAITHNIKYIFSVPCCQKEINSQIIDKTFPLMLSHGLTKERFSALLTDTLRAGILTANGYSVDLMEFVGFESTPKNLLIRAKLSNLSAKKRADSLDEAKKTLKFFGIKQTLFTLIYGDKYD